MNLIDRINAYIKIRAINPRTVTRRQYREQYGNMIPVSEVQVIVAMVMAGNIEQFFDHYDQIAPESRRTQQLPSNLPNGMPRMENPPPPPPETKVVELDLTPNRPDIPNSTPIRTS